MKVTITQITIGAAFTLAIFAGTNETLGQVSDDRIVFMSDRGGNRDLYLMNADGTNVVQLTNDAAQDLHPAWSPDKQQIAFVSNQDGDFGIYVMNPGGGNVRRVIGGSGAHYEHPAWSPDGSRLAYSSDEAGSFDLYTISVSGGQATRLTSSDEDETDSSWSPDGSQIVYLQTVDGAYEVFEVSGGGGIGQQIVESNGGDYFSPRWSPDGTMLAYATTIFDNMGSISELYIHNLEDDSERLLTSAEDSFIAGISWSQDGSELIYTLRSTSGNWTINAIDKNGNSARVLTQPDYNSETPSWYSPEGSAPPLSLPDFDCPGAPPPRIAIGDTVRVTPGLANNVRSGPGTGYRVIGMIPAGDVSRVLEGPECADGYIWWRVDYDGLVGWTVEGEPNYYWLESVSSSSNSSANPTSGQSQSGNYPTQCAQSLPTRIGVDMRIRAITQVRLRSAPTSPSGTALANGTDMITIGEPVCAHLENDPNKGELLWWPVRVLEGNLAGAEGWVAESGMNRYNVAIDTTP